MSLKNVNTKNVSYEGCPAEIAQALSKGKMIKCFVSDNVQGLSKNMNKFWIIAYNRDLDFPYIEDDQTVWKYARAVPKKQLYVKKPLSLMAQLIEDGYEVDDTGLWYCSEDLDFRPEMWVSCGNLPLIACAWKPEWLEEK